MKIHYVGHSTLFIETNMKIIIDPYLRGKGREGLLRFNPNAYLSLGEVNPNVILLTHSHGDHFGQTFEVLEGTKAKLVASRRLCDFVGKRIREHRLLRIEPNKRLNIDETRARKRSDLSFENFLYRIIYKKVSKLTFSRDEKFYAQDISLSIVESFH